MRGRWRGIQYSMRALSVCECCAMCGVKPKEWSTGSSVSSVTGALHEGKELTRQAVSGPTTTCG